MKKTSQMIPWIAFFVVITLGTLLFYFRGARVDPFEMLAFIVLVGFAAGMLFYLIDPLSNHSFKWKGIVDLGGSAASRAFGLVGALSIIRFRTVVKEPRDTAFLFAAIITGMACGTQHFAISLALVLFLTALLIVLDHFDYGTAIAGECFLRITLKNECAAHEWIEGEVTTTIPHSHQISRIGDLGDGCLTLVYSFPSSSRKQVVPLEHRLARTPGVVQTVVSEGSE